MDFEANNMEAVRLFFQYGADPEMVDDNGFRPLSNAILTGKPDIVEVLLSYGADPPDIGYGISALNPENIPAEALPIGARAALNTIIFAEIAMGMRNLFLQYAGTPKKHAKKLWCAPISEQSCEGVGESPLASTCLLEDAK